MTIVVRVDVAERDPGPGLIARVRGIIHGEIPGRFVWRDETAVAWIDIGPLTPGHTLVVPILEIDRWTDLPEDIASYCMGVSHKIANAQLAVWPVPRAGLMIAGKRKN